MSWSRMPDSWRWRPPRAWAGGEPAQLAEVLQAKEALKLPPVLFAYDVVLKDLKARRDGGASDGQSLTKAIEALEAVRKPD